MTDLMDRLGGLRQTPHAPDDFTVAADVARGVRARRRRNAARGASSGVFLLTAAGLGAVVVSNDGSDRSTTQAGPPVTTPPSAKVVLARAAYQVAGQPLARPRDDQWILETGAESPDKRNWAANWSSFDGRKDAQRQSADGSGGYYLPRPGDRIVVQTLPDHQNVPSPAQWWDGLAALPSDPHALIVALRHSPLLTGPNRPKGATQAGRDFDAVTTCLSQAPVIAPEAHARLFRALATIPGVQVDPNATDATGTHVLSITFSGQSGERLVTRSRSELLLDPTTYAYRGFRQTALEDSPPDPTGTLYEAKKGEVWFNYAEPVSAVVDTPGPGRLTTQTPQRKGLRKH